MDDAVRDAAADRGIGTKVRGARAAEREEGDKAAVGRVIKCAVIDDRPDHEAGAREVARAGRLDGQVSVGLGIDGAEGRRGVDEDIARSGQGATGSVEGATGDGGGAGEGVRAVEQKRTRAGLGQAARACDGAGRGAVGDRERGATERDIAAQEVIDRRRGAVEGEGAAGDRVGGDVAADGDRAGGDVGRQVAGDVDRAPRDAADDDRVIGEVRCARAAQSGQGDRAREAREVDRAGVGDRREAEVGPRNGGRSVRIDGEGRAGVVVDGRQHRAVVDRDGRSGGEGAGASDERAGVDRGRTGESVGDRERQRGIASLDEFSRAGNGSGQGGVDVGRERAGDRAEIGRAIEGQGTRVRRRITQREVGAEDDIIGEESRRGSGR